MKNKAALTKSSNKHAKKVLRKDKGFGKNKNKNKRFPESKSRRKNDRGEMFDPKFKAELEKGDDIDIDVDDMMQMIDREDDREDQDYGIDQDFEQQWMEKTKKLEKIQEARTKKDIAAQKKASIQPIEESQLESSDDEDKDENGEKKPKNIAYDQLSELSYLENLLMVRQKKEELRQTLAQLSNSVMEHPEMNIRKMNKLLAMLDVDNTDPQFGLIFLNVQTLTCKSVCLVLCDIVPNFRYSERFRHQDVNENTKKLKRDTIKQAEYEKSVVQFYQLFMKRLIRMVDATVITGPKNKSKSNFIRAMISSHEARRQISLVAIECLCELIEAHPNFNYADQIIDVLARVFCNTFPESIALRQRCALAFRRIFQRDTLGEASLKSVTSLSEHILQQNFRVDPTVFASFSYLEFKELAQDIEAVKRAQLGKSSREKKDRNKMSRKERKNAKKMGKLEKELLEAEATESRDKIIENKIEIHKKVFALYFRFLKRSTEVDEISADSKIDDLYTWYTPLFCVMFDDIAKFSVYLNDVYVYELIELMLKMINRDSEAADASEVGHLQGATKLRCLKAIFKILSLTDNSLNIDFHQPYNILYESCIDSRIALSNSYPVLLECFNEMVLKQHKLLSPKRMVAFAQRILSLLPYLSGNDADRLIEILRRLFALIPSLAETLFDSEDVLESGPAKIPKMQQTLDTAGVSQCSIFELTSMLRVNCNERVRNFAQTLLEMP